MGELERRGVRTTEIAQLLHKGQVGSPEMLGGQERRGTARPAHLLREEGARSVGADAGSQAQRDVLDLPAAIDGAKSVFDWWLARDNFHAGARRVAG